MVSKASDDFPDPEMPVKTMSWSRGSSRSTFLRLCSRAPRTRIVSAILARVPALTAGRTDVRQRVGRVSAHRAQLPLELRDLAAQAGCLLEPQILRRLVHLLLERLDEPPEVVGRDPGEIEHR